MEPLLLLEGSLVPCDNDDADDDDDDDPAPVVVVKESTATAAIVTAIAIPLALPANPKKDPGLDENWMETDEGGRESVGDIVGVGEEDRRAVGLRDPPSSPDMKEVVGRGVRERL